MRLERRCGTTVLTSTVIDQSRLHGILDQVQELGLELVSIEVTVDSRGDRAGGTPTDGGSGVAQ